MTTTPTRFRYRRGQRTESHQRVVTRATQYGNPYPVAEWGLGPSLLLYRAWIQLDEPREVRKGLIRTGRQVVEAARRNLPGFDLGCACELGAPCHADILLEIVNS